MADINNSLGFTGTIVNPLQDLQSVLTVGNTADLTINLVDNFENPGSDQSILSNTELNIINNLGDNASITPTAILSISGDNRETSINYDSGLVLVNKVDTSPVNILNNDARVPYRIYTPNLADNGSGNNHFLPISVNGIEADITGNIVAPFVETQTLQDVVDLGNTVTDVAIIFDNTSNSAATYVNDNGVTVITDNAEASINVGGINISDLISGNTTSVAPGIITMINGAIPAGVELSSSNVLESYILYAPNSVGGVQRTIPLSVNGNFANSDGEITMTISGYQLTSEKNNANGYAGLDGSGKLSASQLPAIAVTEVYTVASQVAQLALVADEGDVAIRTDLSKSYIHNGGVTGTMADWSELLTPTGAVTSVTGTTNRITSTGGTTPVIDISAAYVGQTSITTLGTIATGTWQGTAVADTYISSASVWNAKVGPTRTLTINGTAQDLSANRTWTVGDVIMSPGAVQIATTQTGSSAIGILNLEQTWNTTGTPTMLKMNVVDTTSNAASLLFDFQMGGISRVRSSKAGVVTSNGFNSSAGGILGSYFDTSGNVFNFGNTSLFGATGTATVATSGAKHAFYANYGWAPTSGTSTMSVFSYNGTINQTGGANGITRGVHIAPTLTSAADFRAIEATTGAVVLPIRAVSTTSSLSNSDYFVTVTGTITVTLPTSVAGKIIKMKNIGAGTITINPPSGTIDGVGSKTLNTQYAGYEFTADGTNWLITGAF